MTTEPIRERNRPRPPVRRIALILVSLLALSASSGHAQLAAAHMMTAFGLKSGSQAPPGGFLVPTYINWNVDRIVGRDGDEVPLDLNVDALALFAWVVTPKKLLGGNYGFQVIAPSLSNSVELPRLGYESGSSLGFGDLYVQPVNLGWHTPRADFMAGLGFYAPTGSYEAGGDDNKGMGMWSYELSGGSTLYFDQKQQFHISALGFYELHSSKEDQDLKAGSVLTVEGGLGGTFLKGGLNVGVAYGAQWKITEDSGDDFPSTVLPGKNHSYTIGPEASLVGFYKPPWMVSLTARYLWDVGAKSSFEGNRLIVFATIGHLRLPPAAETTTQ
jgi:hypothetical protein